MPRVRKGAARRRKHKRVLRAARGFVGAASRRYRVALEKTFRAGVFATRDRRTRKRQFRRLWITRITAACKQRGVQYSRFIFGLERAGIELNRKMLSEIAIADPEAFEKILGIATGEAPAEPEPKAEVKPKAKKVKKVKKVKKAQAKPDTDEKAKTKPKAKKAKKATKAKKADESGDEKG